MLKPTICQKTRASNRAEESLDVVKPEINSLINQSNSDFIPKLNLEPEYSLMTKK